ncbi:MAG: sialidase family protein [Chloroflexota bacterium]
MMLTRRTQLLGWRLLCAFALAASVGGATPARADDNQPAQKMNNKIQQKLLSGFAELQLNHPELTGASSHAQSGNQEGNGNGVHDTGDDRRSWPFYYPTEDDNCPQNRGSNVRVNQDCQNVSDIDLSGRGQAQNETSIAYDPRNPRHMVASFNDYRRGDGNCGGSFSLDSGHNWAEDVIPMSFTRGTAKFGSQTVKFGASRQYWTTGGDTSVAFDTQGNAYFSCQVFNRGNPASNNKDQSSALLVFRSTGNDGASWNFPGRYVTAIDNTVGNPAVLEDKQLMTVDNHPGSPFQDRVYVTWTEFAADGTAYIWAAYSADYGETFSDRHLVSVNSPAYCTNTYGVPAPEGSCNANQFSQPFTSPDGTLYVVFNNFNNPTASFKGADAPSEEPTEASTGGPAAPGGSPVPVTVQNRNSVLLSKSTDGGNTFSAPVKVADYYDLPDCPTYQGGKSFGRACVPEKGPTTNSYFRAANYASGSVNPTRPNQVVVTFGSYVNKYSNESRPNPCVPLGVNPDTGNNLYYGVKTPGACNNKILVSISDNAGATFTGTTTDPRLLPTVNQAPRQIGTDQWFQWADFTPDGRLAVSYYDRQYGDDEITGYSDFSISGTRDLRNLLNPKFGVSRVTTGSMPPPTQFLGLFWGDYTWITAPDQAYPIWSDTRNPQLVLCPETGKPGVPPKVCTTSATNAPRANDQDVFTRGIAIPLAGERDEDTGNDGNG